MRIFSKKLGKRFAGFCVLALTAMYLFATGAHAQEANLTAKKSAIQYDKAHISYGDIWGFTEEDHNGSHYNLAGAGTGLTWYIDGGKGITSEPGKGSYEGTTYFETAVIADNGNFDAEGSIPMQQVPYAALVSNVSAGYVDAPVGNGLTIPVVTAGESGGVYSVVPGKAGTYYVHAYVANATEAALELDYALLDSCGDTNAFAANPFGAGTKLTLNRIGESGWYRGQISVSTLSWYAVNISGGKDSSGSNTGNTGTGTKNGGVTNDLTLGGGNSTTYYYNTWNSAEVYYDTVLAIKLPAGSSLGPISSLGKLTIANDGAKGSLTATSIFGEALTLNEELAIPNMPILLNAQSNGYNVFSGFTSGGQNVQQVDGSNDANRLKVIAEEQTFVYYHEGNADARDLTMNWADPVALPMINVSGLTAGAGDFNFINKKEGSGQSVRGTKQSVAFTLDFSNAADVASVVYTVSGDSINGVTSYNGELTAAQNVLTADVMFDTTIVEITATDTNGTAYVFKYTVNPVGSGDAVVKNLSTGKTYAFIEDALIEAASGQRILLLKDGSFVDKALTGGHLSKSWLDNNAGYTVKSGVTLQVPFDDAATLITTNMKDNVVPYPQYPACVLYRKLTIPAGINLNVEDGGSVNVGSRANAQMIGQSGDYALIEMGADSKITINNGAALYAWGYIWGEGSVDVLSGGKVYQPFAIKDYTGDAGVCLTVFSGDTTPIDTSNYLGAITTLSNKTKGGNCFPLRAFTVCNVEVPMTINYGASMYGFYHLYGEQAGSHGDNLVMIGKADTAMIQMKDESAYVVMSYSNGRQRVEFNGNISFNALQLSISFLITIDVTSANTSGVAIPGCWDMVVNSGTFTLGDNCILTEGGTVTIAQGAVLDTKGKNAYVLAAADDPGSVASTDIHGVAYIPNDVNSCLDINGTLRVSGGFYTTLAKSVIKSSQGTGVVEFTGNRKALTEKLLTHVGAGSIPVKVGQNTWQQLQIIPAELMNADGSYVQVEEAAANYIYNSQTGIWEKVCDHKWQVTYTWAEDYSTCTATRVCGNDASHTMNAAAVISVVTDATCEQGGTAVYTATFEAEWAEVQTQEVSVSATGHAWGEVSYVWAEDGSACTATRVCGNDPEHTESAEATVSMKLKTAPTTVSEGAVTATAKFTPDWAKSQTKNIVVPANTVVFSSFNLAVKGKVTLQMKFNVPADLLSANPEEGSLAKVVWQKELFDGSSQSGEAKEVYFGTDEMDAMYISNCVQVDEYLASGEMSSDVTVQFYGIDGEPMNIFVVSAGNEMGKTVDKLARSVIDYAEIAAERGNTYLKALAAGLSNFGKYAQINFKSNTYNGEVRDALAYEGAVIHDLEAWDEQFEATRERFVDKESKELGEITWGVQSLGLTESGYLKKKLSLAEGCAAEDYIVTVTYTDDDGNSISANAAIKYTDKDKYHIIINNVPVAMWDTEFTIRVVRKDDVNGAADTHTTTFLNWALKCINAYEGATETNKVNQLNMAKAMYLYCKAASDYFENK